MKICIKSDATDDIIRAAHSDYFDMLEDLLDRFNVQYRNIHVVNGGRIFYIEPGQVEFKHPNSDEYVPLLRAELDADGSVYLSDKKYGGGWNVIHVPLEEVFVELDDGTYMNYLSENKSINSSRQIKSGWERTDMASGPIWDNDNWRIIERRNHYNQDKVTEKWYMLRDKNDLSKDDVSFDTLAEAMDYVDFRDNLNSSRQIKSGFDKETLIEKINEVEPDDYSDWSVEELQELAINLGISIESSRRPVNSSQTLFSGNYGNDTINLNKNSITDMPEWLYDKYEYGRSEWKWLIDAISNHKWKSGFKGNSLYFTDGNVDVIIGENQARFKVYKITPDIKRIAEYLSYSYNGKDENDVTDVVIQKRDIEQFIKDLLHDYVYKRTYSSNRLVKSGMQHKDISNISPDSWRDGSELPEKNFSNMSIEVFNQDGDEVFYDFEAKQWYYYPTHKKALVKKWVEKNFVNSSRKITSSYQTAINELEEYFERSGSGNDDEYTIYTRTLSRDDENHIAKICEDNDCDFAIGTSHVTIYPIESSRKITSARYIATDPESGEVLGSADTYDEAIEQWGEDVTITDSEVAEGQEDTGLFQSRRPVKSENKYGADIDRIYEKQLNRIKKLRAKGYSDDEIDDDEIVRQTKEDMRNVGKIKSSNSFEKSVMSGYERNNNNINKIFNSAM